MGRLRLLHTSDLHINALKKFPGYLDRMQSTLTSIHAIAVKKACDLIVVAGDVWETRSITHNERQLFSDWLGKSPVPVVVTSGNHDKRSRAIGDTSLSYLSSLSSIMKRHLIWDGAPTIRDFHGCRFILLPAEDWSHTEMDLMLQALTAHAQATNKKGYPIVVVLHEAINGAKTDSGWKPKTKTTVTLHESRFPMVSYWALGDIHKCQQIISNGWYSGSPHQIKFDEKPNNGVLVVDLHKTGTKVKIVPIKSKPLLQLSELPDPPPKNAYIVYEPTKIEGKIDLPPNVVYHPSAQLFKRDKRSAGAATGLLDRLDVWLKDAGQKKKTRRRSWKLVKQMCAALDHEIEIPKKYRKLKPEG